MVDTRVTDALVHWGNLLMDATAANSSCKRLETEGLRLEVGTIKSYRLDPFPTYSLQSKAYGLFIGDLTADLKGV